MHIHQGLRRISAIGITSMLLAAGYGVPHAAMAGGPQASDGASGARATPELAARIDRGGGVVVKVTPREIGGGASAWMFVVAMDTHSQDLSQDMARVAALVDKQGRRHAPLAWEGTGPGGHHRQGTLTFRALDDSGDAVVLEIRDVGAVPLRTFRWQLAR